MLEYDPKDPFFPLVKKLAIILDKKIPPEDSRISDGEIVSYLEEYCEKCLCRFGARFTKEGWVIGRIIISNKTEVWTVNCFGRDLFEVILDFIVRDYERNGHRLKEENKGKIRA